MLKVQEVSKRIVWASGTVGLLSLDCPAYIDMVPHDLTCSLEIRQIHGPTWSKMQGGFYALVAVEFLLGSLVPVLSAGDRFVHYWTLFCLLTYQKGST